MVAILVEELLIAAHGYQASSHDTLGIKVTPVLAISSVVTVENLGTSLIVVVLIAVFIFTERVTQLNTILEEVELFAVNFLRACHQIATVVEVIPISIFILDKGILSLISTS